MRHRVAARLTTALALVAASLAWAGPASAAEGFSVSLGQAPATFTIGKAAKPLTAVAATDRDGRCRRVRWSLTVRTDGVSLDQVRINRIENGQAFRVRARLGADSARLTDARNDPGQLCRGRNVTGRWDIAFVGPDSGRVTFEARALDGGGRELAAASVTSRVVAPVAATTSPTAPATADETPADQATDDAAGATDAGQSAGAALNPTAGTPSVLGPGLIIGAVLVFLGVALLLRIRTRNRRDAWQAQTQILPTGFSSMPRRRRR